MGTGCPIRVLVSYGSSTAFLQPTRARARSFYLTLGPGSYETIFKKLPTDLLIDALKIQTENFFSMILFTKTYKNPSFWTSSIESTDFFLVCVYVSVSYFRGKTRAKGGSTFAWL